MVSPRKSKLSARSIDQTTTELYLYSMY